MKATFKVFHPVEIGSTEEGYHRWATNCGLCASRLEQANGGFALWHVEGTQEQIATLSADLAYGPITESA
jgi:hypothetical protein